MNYLILALATWRISSLLANEDGPLDIFERLRKLVGVDADEYGQVFGGNSLARGWICVWCNSIWVGALWALAYYIEPLAWWFALPLALSAVAVVIETVIDQNDEPVAVSSWSHGNSESVTWETAHAAHNTTANGEEFLHGKS